VNPPVHAWAALEVFELDGGTDWDFLRRIFLKLVANFTWWLNLKDADEDNLFEGGFLGLDNIGPFDRSKPLDAGARLQQADATAWMVRYALDMLGIAVRLADHDSVYEDLAIKFLLHFARIADALNEGGMWDDEEGFYFDQVLLPDGNRIPVKVRSMVGLLAATGAATFPAGAPKRLGEFGRQVGRRFAETSSFHWGRPDDNDDHHLLAIVDPERLRTVLHWVLDERPFLSPGGLRSLSKIHQERPFTFTFGSFTSRVDYEPAESTTGMFGGNSNWRGPVWFPVNHMFITSLRRYHQHLGDGFTVECPTGSGNQLTLAEVADELAGRLVSIFLPGPDGRRPVWGDVPLLADDPALERPDPVLRVLPRRHGGRARGLAPDRLDGSGGRPHRQGTPGAGDLLNRAGQGAPEVVTASGVSGTSTRARVTTSRSTATSATTAASPAATSRMRSTQASPLRPDSAASREARVSSIRSGTAASAASAASMSATRSASAGSAASRSAAARSRLVAAVARRAERSRSCWGTGSSPSASPRRSSASDGAASPGMNRSTRSTKPAVRSATLAALVTESRMFPPRAAAMSRVASVAVAARSAPLAVRERT
jgi:hypothetical protein